MKKLIATALAIFLLVFLFFSYRWVRHRVEYAISDAAFVRSDHLATLSFEVDGRIVEINPEVGSEVKAGDILAKIDSSLIESKVSVKEAMVQSIHEQIRKLKFEKSRIMLELGANLDSASLNLQKSKANEEIASKEFDSAKISFEQSERELKRAESLFKEGLLPKKQYEQALLDYSISKNRLDSANSSLKIARAQTSQAMSTISELRAKMRVTQEIDAQIGSLQAQASAIIEEINLIKLELLKTSLEAPFDGFVARRFASQGDTIRAGQPVLALLKKDSLFVEVLLEETSLKGIRVGSKATFKLDAYPDEVFMGEVISISPATAASFAILPRDISSGEFVKLVQRVPVRIKLTQGPMHLLRVGMGGSVKIKRE
ncbi:MAG: HlyD family efflux transporter periplasmic adaptor subunit [Aquificaceae bacterium]